MEGLDRTDAEILRLLQRDAQMPHAQIAEQVSLSPSAVSRRIDALKKDGTIVGQQVVLSREQLGLPTTVFTLVTLKTHGGSEFGKFERDVEASLPHVLECVRLCGTWDYLLRFVVRDMEHYGNLQRKLTDLPTVKLVRSHAVMGPVQMRSLPIN